MKRLFVGYGARFGARFWLRFFGVVVFAASFGIASTQAAEADDPLFTELAKVSGVAGKFKDEKQIALLKAPLRSEGTIHFLRGRGLARHTLSPQKQSLLVTERSIVFWNGKKTETIGLGSASSLKSFAEAFSLMLAGDRRGLEKNFAIAIEGDAKKAWTLKLTPKDDSLKKLVTSIEVRGDGRSIGSLVVRESSGDVSTSTFTDVDLDHHYDDKEAASVFSVPAM